MKNFLNLRFVVLLSLLTFFLSCQKEDKELIDETNEGDTIAVDSNLTSLLRNASLNDGSFDNIIDGSSCMDIMYPVEVIANGQKLTIQSKADLELIVEIFGTFPNDEDTMEIIFPMNVILEDFTEITINNQADFRALVEACDNISESLSCVEFSYPINIFLYNESNEQTATVTINSDSQWFDFLLNLEEGTLFSIDYPMTIIINNVSTTINNNQELITALQTVDCDIDPNDPDPIEIEAILTNGDWYVNYFFDDWDNTYYYAGYKFNFATDGSVNASNTNGSTAGVWTFEDTNPLNKLDLFFESTGTLENCNEDWSIIGIDENTIRLKNVSGDGSIDFLSYGRNPYEGSGNVELNNFINELTSANLFLTLLDDNGDLETCNFITYEFQFNLDGTVVATSETDTREGFWMAEVNTDNEIDLILNFNLNGTDDIFEELNDDWDVDTFDTGIIELMDESGGNGGIDYLSFGIVPPDC